MSVIVKKIQQYIFENQLIEPGSKIVVGVSGGPDSIFLLDILVKLSKKYKTAENKGLLLHVAHVNYDLRGEDSKFDADFTEKLAGNYGLNYSVLDCKNEKNDCCGELEKYKKIGQGNLENIARKIRYNFFEKVRQANNFDMIAVGHNADDQAETVLMRLLRGSGLKGLGAIQPKNGNLVRPLLNISRNEIEHYLQKNDLDYRVDKTNLQNIFTRNKIRNELIPYLEKEFNPNIKEVLANLANQASYDYELINELNKRNFNELVQIIDNDSLNVNISRLTCLSRSSINHLLREMILFLNGDVKNLNSSNLNEVVKVINSNKNKSQIVRFKGLVFKRKGDRMTLTKSK